MKFKTSFDKAVNTFDNPEPLSAEDLQNRRDRRDTLRARRRRGIALKAGAVLAAAAFGASVGPSLANKAEHGISEGARSVAINISTFGNVAAENVGDAVNAVGKELDHIGGSQDRMTNEIHQDDIDSVPTHLNAADIQNMGDQIKVGQEDTYFMNSVAAQNAMGLAEQEQVSQPPHK